MTTTFYKRPLPTGCVPFASDEGRRIFHEALAAGTVEGYFALAEQFHTQSDPGFCGLGTLVVVLNALAIDPGPERTWKGPWRWFSEEHLDCCRPLPEIQHSGITLHQLACLARCNGARVELHLADSTTVEDFRAMVREAATTAGEPHLVVSYDRSTLGQTGAGHFSPVGGYHAGRDLVLILDVARFKYPPHWVPLQELFGAMLPADPETGRSRGFARFWRRCQTVSLCSLTATDTSWRSLICELVAVGSVQAATLEELLPQLLRRLSRQALMLVATQLDAEQPPEVGAAHAAFWRELEQTEILRLVRSALSGTDVDVVTVSLLLLLLPTRFLGQLKEPLRERLEQLGDLGALPQAVRAQVEYLRAQASALEEMGTGGGPACGIRG